MKVIKMNTAQIEKLISLVSKQPALYNANNVEYADQHKRDVLWEEIGNELKVSADLCRAKWTILRSGYRKALRTRTAYARKKWRFEDNMSFLQDCIQPRPKRRKENYDYNIPEDDEALDIKIEPEEMNFEDDKASSCDSTSIPLSELVKSFQAGAAKNETSSNSDRDAVTLFFMGMAETVKTFSPLMQAKVKAEVFQCVNSAEMKFLQG